MPTRHSTARWEGTIGDGKGQMTVGDGVWSGSFSAPSRFEDGEGTNPEELIGAAHAGCFSMALSAALTRAGHEPTSITTRADVTIEKVDGDWTITTVVLDTEADVPGLSDDEFQEFAQGAKRNCPVSRALSGGPEVQLQAKLVG